MAYDYNNNSQKPLAKRNAEVTTSYDEYGFDAPEVKQAQPMQMNPMGMSASVAREVAKVQAQIVMAKFSPRNITVSLKKIEGECSRPKLAKQATYLFSRGGSEVTGPSIRLAESIARNYGNINYGFEEVTTDEEGSTVRAYAYDMENNTQAERIFHVSPYRDNGKLLTSERDLYENVANKASRRVRACILELIPSDIVDYALDICQKTASSSEVVTQETIQNMAEAFRTRYKVSQVQLEAYLGRNLSSITPVQLGKLRTIFGSLNDGVASVSDFFKSEDESEEKRKEKGKQAQQPVSKAPAPAPAPEPEPMPEDNYPDDYPEGPEAFTDEDEYPEI